MRLMQRGQEGVPVCSPIPTTCAPSYTNVNPLPKEAEVPVGCAIVHQGKILAVGSNKVQPPLPPPQARAFMRWHAHALAWPCTSRPARTPWLLLRSLSVLWPTIAGPIFHFHRQLFLA